MYICKDCGALFEEPVVWYDDPSPTGVSLPSGCYEYHECPSCGSDDFTEAKECEACGDHYDGDSILCPSCMERFGMELKAIKGLFELDQDNFEQAICDYFGW